MVSETSPNAPTGQAPDVLAVPSAQVRRFAALFAGYQRAYGTFALYGTAARGKRKGKATTVHQPAVPLIFERHLMGDGPGIGIIPLRDDDTVCFGALDVDDQHVDHAQLAAAVQELGLPLVVCRSKSGGAHLYVFFARPIPAWDARDRLQGWSAQLGFPRGTECFPKQSFRDTEAEIGSWINVPYYNARATDRYAVLDDGQPATFEQFLDHAETHKVRVEDDAAEDSLLAGEDDDGDFPVRDTSPTVTPEQINQTNGGATTALFPDGPPCLQRLEAQGGFAEGTRNTGMAAVMVYLRKRYGDKWLDHVEEYRQQLAPDLDAAEVRAVVKSYRKRAYNFSCAASPLCEHCDRATCVTRRYGVSRALSEVESLNRTHALVLIGGTVRIIRFKEHDPRDFTLLHLDAFRTWYGNKAVETVRKGKPWVTSLAEAWLQWPGRRQFDNGLVFEPGPPYTPNSFNLFSSWAVVTTEAGDCSLFKAHLRENVCNGDATHFAWVWAWLADLFQHPAKKPGTSLVLRGRQGTGKSIVGRVIGKLLGPYYRTVARAALITGQFNAHLECILLLQAEEAFWAGDKQAEGTLKDWITNDRQQLTRKGVDTVEVANHGRLLVTSNSDWVVPAGMEERRFAVLDVAEAHMQDHPYFAAMEDQIDAGGAGRLLYELLATDISDINLRQVPQTAALLEQKIASMPPDQKWLLDIIRNATLPGDREGEGASFTAQLHESYVAAAKSLGAPRRSSQTELGILLRKVLPGIKKERRASEGGALKWVYMLPPLPECRAALDARLGAQDWGEDADDAWQPDAPEEQHEPVPPERSTAQWTFDREFSADQLTRDGQRHRLGP